MEMVIPSIPANLNTHLPLGLQDLEQLRLLVTGNSALDWNRLAIHTRSEALQLLNLLGIHPENPQDQAIIRDVFERSLTYLDTFVHYYVSSEVRYLDDPIELFLIASGSGISQKDACMLLKVMHVVYHVKGRELLYRLPVPIQELFRRVKSMVFQAVDGLKAQGIRIVQFEGSRKTNPSIYTKLLCRTDSLAAEVHDRIRFRIITEDITGTFDALIYLTRTLFPFNYIVPGESRNDLLDIEATYQADPYLAEIAKDLQPLENLKQSNNPYSAKDFKIINFVVDLPVRVDDLVKTIPDHQAADGHIVFLLVEFQLVDQHTHHNNSTGVNRHSLYKERQIKKAIERLSGQKK